MSEKYKFHEPDGLYFITPTIVNWIDVFTKPEYCQLIINSLKYCQKNKGLVIHAWIIMSNHLHLIVSKGDAVLLSDIIRDFKTFTSKEIINAIKESRTSRKKWMLELFRIRANQLKRVSRYKLWQDGNHPILLDSNQMIGQRLNYLHNNPVTAGLVYEPEHFFFSSAIDYCGGRGLLEIELID